jgi:hypothetical protein
MLNHSNDATTHYLVHQGLENNEKLKDSPARKVQEDNDSFEMSAEDQYILKKNKIDLSLFKSIK